VSTYAWSTGDTLADITVNSSGIYWVDVTSDCGTDRDTIVVSVFLAQVVDFGNDTLLCQGASMLYTVTEPIGGMINWFNNSSNDSILISIPTVVWVELVDSNGCTVVDSVEVTYLPIIPYDLGPDVSFCAGDSVTLGNTTMSIQSYDWNTNETSSQITVSTPSIYSVDLIDTNGCMIFDTIEVFENTLPVPQIDGPTSYCDYDTVVYSENGSFPSYVWHSLETTSSISHGGSIDVLSVQVTDVNGCIGYDSLEVNMIEVPELFLGADLIVCDSNLVLDATTPLADSYLWSTSETTPTISAGIGTYSVEVTYGICSIFDSVTVSQIEIPFDLGPDFTICEDEDIFLGHELTWIDSIIWNDGTNTTLYEYTAPYEILDTIVISAIAHGCGYAYDTVVVIVEDCDCPVFVPNTFTPNGDEYNNVFKVYSDCALEYFNFRLYNRWGEVIFESNTLEFVWDGTNGNGQVVQDGTYTWEMSYHIINNSGKELVRKRVGHVNLLK
jgi:gliding motility-associated-like protein